MAEHDAYGLPHDHDDTCPRCWGIQVTHHPLCQARDGTPQPFTNAQVKMMMGASRGNVSNLIWQVTQPGYFGILERACGPVDRVAVLTILHAEAKTPQEVHLLEDALREAKRQP